MKIFNKLAPYILTLSLAMAPKLKALDGIVKNPLTGEGIPNAIVQLEEDNNIVGSTRTDDEGFYQVNPTSVTLPQPNLPSQNKINNVTLIDLEGRTKADLRLEELTRDLPSRYNLASGIWFLKADNGSTIRFVNIDGYMTFNPLEKLVKRDNEIRESLKNRSSSTDGINEGEYFLNVSDDNEEEIGDFYNKRVRVDDLDQNNFDVEMMYNPDMENLDLLTLLSHIDGNVISNEGAYPEGYPRTIFLDSIICYEHFRDEEKAEMYLRTARNSMVEMGEELNIEDYITEDVTGNLYGRDALGTKIAYHDGDNRFDWDNNILYINDGVPLENEDDLKRLYKHEMLHFMGLEDSYDYDDTIMGINYRFLGITRDDATAIRWRTYAKDQTDLTEFSSD